MKTSVVVTLLLSVVLTSSIAGVVSADAQSSRNTSLIVDCASFRAWFAKQPGSTITLDSIGPAAKAPAPKGGSDSFADDPSTGGFAHGYADGMKSFRGHVGGGGCLGGFYDPQRRTARIVDLYDTARDDVLTTTTSVPQGLPSRDLSSRATVNGVKLGMTKAQVQRIEGPGASARGGSVLVYSWQHANGEAYSLSILFEGGVVVAIDYGWGF